MDYFLRLDQQIFLFINHLPHYWFLNELAKLFSGIGAWGAIWLAISIVLFYREERRDHWFFAPVLLATGVGIILSEYVLKYLIARPRPGIDIGAMIVQPTGNFSFPSTHATLSFALATVLIAQEPRLRAWLYMLAICISLSRIYLGVHFAFDVVAGAILGVAIGHAAIFISKRIRTRYSNNKSSHSHRR